MGICRKGGKACGGLYSQRISKVDGNDGGIVTQAVSHWRIMLNVSVVTVRFVVHKLWFSSANYHSVVSNVTIMCWWYKRPI
jgi:hypothetical protein